VGVIMTNSKELEQLKKDLDLVTKTAKVLANKLEKMSNTFEQRHQQETRKQGV